MAIITLKKQRMLIQQVLQTSNFSAAWGSAYPIDPTGNLRVVIPAVAAGVEGDVIRLSRVDSNSANSIHIQLQSAEVFRDSFNASNIIGFSLKPGGTVDILNTPTGVVLMGHNGVAAGLRLWVPTDEWTSTELPGFYKAESLAGTAGTAISSWADSSGNSRAATQGTGTKQPTRDNTTFAGFSTASFDSSDDSLVSAAFPATGWDTTDHVIAFAGRLGTTTDDAIGTGGTSDGHALLMSNAGVIRGHVFRDTTTNIDGAAVSTSSNIMMLQRLSGTTLGVVVNGGTPATNTVTGTSGAGAPTDFIIGGRAAAGGFSGSMAEVIAIHATVTDAQLDKLHGYWAHKFAMTGVLGAGHAYKNNAPLAASFSY